MNGKSLEREITRDIEKVKKDLAKLKDVSVTELSRRIDLLAEEAKKTASTATQSLGESVGQGLSQYNTKVQEVVDRVPGNIGEKAAGYPWVAISATLLLGLLIGAIIKPAR